MYVVKRDGRREAVFFDKITARIQKLSFGLDPLVCAAEVAQKVVLGVYKGVTTSELDDLAAETAASLTTRHPDYATLASRIAVSNLHKNTRPAFSETVRALHAYVEPRSGLAAPLIADDVLRVVEDNAETLDAALVHERDYDYDYFGFKTLERSYLLRLDGRVAERPQHMLMRVAVGIHGRDVAAALETYRLMSKRFYTHASPTLFNAGTPRPQLSSCFLLSLSDDSIEGIYDTLKQCAVISKNAGGVGLSIHTLRARGSYIRGTNGSSNGLVPMLRVYNDTARYVDQGGGKRKGAFAVYLEPWHADVLEFLELKKNHGKDENRARDLFYGLWIPDLFMRRVEADADWSLFCPNEAPGLADVWGEEFEQLYARYEREGRARRVLRAQKLWFAILEAQVEAGTPYMLYKDAANRKSNQRNLGTIRGSNLCTEIIQFTSPEETAVCNLASVALPRFVHDGVFDFEHLADVVRHVVVSLNRVIDVNYYPSEQAARSNLRHRPVGLGVQGLADAFILMRLPFESPEAQRLNRDIFECMYFAALTASKDLARRDGPYESYAGSPVSQGELQFDMWSVQPSGRWDWPGLREEIRQHGVRNSLLLAPMPTASTAQILGNNESIEPYTSNIYTRRVLAGEFTVVNKHLLADLMRLGLWTPTMKDMIVASYGSIQGIEEIPPDIRALYKTVWEISQKTLVDMAADRGAFIDQSQSFNVHMQDANFAKLTSMHFYAWKRGLKTGMYYLRTKAAADPIQFSIDQQTLRRAREQREQETTVAALFDSREEGLDAAVCSLENPDGCLSCGS